MKNFKMILLVALMILLTGCGITPDIQNEIVEPAEKLVESSSKFDLSPIEAWCGEPVGQIRMVGGWLDENGYLEDETGNVWEWFGTLPDCGFCLLWIDNMGTPDFVQDDEIVKLWVEFQDWG